MVDRRSWSSSEGGRWPARVAPASLPSLKWITPARVPSMRRAAVLPVTRIICRRSATDQLLKFPDSIMCLSPFLRIRLLSA